MRAALSAEFKAAIPAYDEHPRTRWIFDWSAQNTVVVSRTFYTQEARPRGLRGRLWGAPPAGVRQERRGVGLPAALALATHTLSPPLPLQVNDAFEELEDGNEDALKEVYEKQKSQLRWGRQTGLSACEQSQDRDRRSLLRHICASPLPPPPPQRPDRAHQQRAHQERPQEAHHAVHHRRARPRRGGAPDRGARGQRDLLPVAEPAALLPAREDQGVHGARPLMQQRSAPCCSCAAPRPAHPPSAPSPPPGRSTSATLRSSTCASTSATAAACASRPSPTAATSRSPRRSAWCWVRARAAAAGAAAAAAVLPPPRSERLPPLASRAQAARPRGPPAPARRRPPRTWRARWACSATSSTAPTRWTTRPWARSTRAWRRWAGAGAALGGTGAASGPGRRLVLPCWRARARAPAAKLESAHLRRSADGRLGLLRRVQPHTRGGAVGVLHPVQGARARSPRPSAPAAWR